MEEERKTNLLLLEGNDDKNVLNALLKIHHLSAQINEATDVVVSDGVDKLLTLDRLSLDVKNYRKGVIGIIVDADTDAPKRFEQVVKILIENCGYLEDDIPKKLDSKGIIIEPHNSKPKLGIWVMPNNKEKGSLESFLLNLIKEKDPLLPLARKTLDHIEKEELNLYNKTAHRDKAEIHTWLAWQEKPGSSFAFTLRERYLTTNETACNNFIKWLKELYSIKSDPTVNK